MGELGEARSRQVGLRRGMFDELAKWKGECAKEVADYHEWHAYRGLQQQTDWLANPTTDLAWNHVREIDKFIHNFNTIQPALAAYQKDDKADLKTDLKTDVSQHCAPCSLIRWLLTEDQRVFRSK
jgi:hypothetical protein